MATIIELGDGGLIAGDPATVLAPENHWCVWCRGDGLDYDDNGELCVCGGCAGFGQNECEDPECAEHQLVGGDVA